MFYYNFHFLCFALNSFLHGLLACIVNVYQQMDGRTDQLAEKEAPCHCLKYFETTHAY